MQPELPIGVVPRDPALRRSLYRLAARLESEGPAGLDIDVSTAAGREAWADMLRTFAWIYTYAHPAQ
jgi:hypothetical protein